MSDSIVVFIESLPTEITVSFIILVLLCCMCIFKDCIICCYRERRANQRVNTLRRLQRENDEIEIIRSLEEAIKQPPPPPRKNRGSLV